MLDNRSSTTFIPRTRYRFVWCVGLQTFIFRPRVLVSGPFSMARNVPIAVCMHVYLFLVVFEQSSSLVSARTLVVLDVDGWKYLSNVTNAHTAAAARAYVAATCHSREKLQVKMLIWALLSSEKMQKAASAVLLASAKGWRVGVHFSLRVVRARICSAFFFCVLVRFGRQSPSGGAFFFLVFSQILAILAHSESCFVILPTLILLQT